MSTDRMRASIAMSVLVPLAAMLVPAAPAGADGGTGMAFVGQASLPAFPCEPGGATPCSGVFGGSISGELSGEKFGVWTATLADARIDATFDYDDAAGHCTTGVAEGTATVVAEQGKVFGSYDRGDILPRSINGLWAQVDFTWQRVGSTAVLTLGNGRVRLNVFALGWVQVMTDSVGTALATFVPEINTSDMPDCVEFTNAPPITARVVGTATLADPA